MAHTRFICQTARAAAGSTAVVREPLWRLIGANNREMGRAPSPAPDGLTCCEAVARLRAGIGQATSRVKLSGPASSWTWALDLDERTVATSGRAYLRQRECLYSLSLFKEAALTAVAAAHCGLAGGLLR